MQALSIHSSSVACGLRLTSSKRSSFTAPTFRTALTGALTGNSRPAGTSPNVPPTLARGRVCSPQACVAVARRWPVVAPIRSQHRGAFSTATRRHRLPLTAERRQTAAPPASGRSASPVVAEGNLFGRVARIVKSYVNSAGAGNAVRTTALC